MTTSSSLYRHVGLGFLIGSLAVTLSNPALKAMVFPFL